MARNIELRRERVLLVQQGKLDEAFEKLKEIWRVEAELRGEKVEVVETVEKVVEPIRKLVEVVVEEKESTIESLVRIKGIGKETVKDIKSLYPTIKDLKEALKSGKRLPLRNDVEKKLKKELL